ncbi:hypothetical protein [Burkholderia vietnamiensis]|nr:hypothetical protein [Burkholderia vietnamiensis]MEC4596125.1 hypothetical protein [Burkholderia vietnamiensis]
MNDDFDSKRRQRFLGEDYFKWLMRISANVTADFGNVTDSAGLGVAQCRL